MRVVKVMGAQPGQPLVCLVDGRGELVARVDEFLRLLAVRAYLPNTIKAYAYDLQKLHLFLEEAGLPVDEFTPARAMDFLGWLRVQSSARRAQRLELGVVARGGRLLSAKTCNRVMAAGSSYFEFLIACEAYTSRENPIVKVTDHAAARVPSRYRPPLANASKQRPVRRVLRVKTVESVPRPMTPETYGALLELMWEGGPRPGEVLGLPLEDGSYAQRRVTIRKRDDHPAGVQQKSRRDRVVDLHEGRALPALSSYVMKERPADAEAPWLFLVGGRGKRRLEPLGYDGMVRMFARAAERAGVRDAWLTPHALRHTLGTQLAEKGARMQTIMKILGHQSPGMSMTYTHISDPSVLAGYQAVLQPGALIAGPIAETLRAGELDQDALDWLKTNFYKTELELGRCLRLRLRLRQEGPCECDLYLTCAKFVTTPEHAPRLRNRLCVEEQLALDAEERGWGREVERHQRIAGRICALLDDLGEPHADPIT